MSPTSGEPLAARSKDDQDPESMDRGIRPYLPVVRALALVETLDPAAAAEVARRSLERFARERQPTESAATRFNRIETLTREEAHAWLREHGGRPSEIVGLPAENAIRATGPGSPIGPVFRDVPPKRCSLMLLEAVGWLPEKYRTVFLLRYLEGLSWHRIGELTGTSSKATETSLAAGWRLFERELAFRLGKLAAS